MSEHSPVAASSVAPQTSFEQALVHSLNLDSWVPGYNLAELYNKLEDEVRDSIKNEEKVIATLRKEIIPRLIKNLKGMDAEIAHRQFTSAHVEKAHLGLLFNGAVEASDGTIVTHDTLPLTVTQIGVCLVSYQGEQGAYAHRIYRKDLQIKGEDPITEVMQLLEERRRQGPADPTIEDGPVNKSKLAQRGLMAYAERAILMEKSKAKWRMGHGNPFPYELLTGFWASRPEMTQAALRVFKRIAEHQRFVFIPSTTQRRELIAIGNALKPLEYIVVDTLAADMSRIITNGGARQPMLGMQEEFVAQYGDKVVLGLFKASALSPAYIFYAHRDHVQTAALVAMADSVLQAYRGFPMLIDIADNICTATFNPDTFFSTIRNAYSEAGQPFRYLSERETRSR